MRTPVLFLARAGLAQYRTGLGRLLSVWESRGGKNLRRRCIPALAGLVARFCNLQQKWVQPRASPCGDHPAGQDRIALHRTFLPGRLRDPRNLAPKGQSAEAQPAEAELAQVGARTSAQLAAVVLARRELGFFVVLGDAACSGHRFLYLCLLTLNELKCLAAPHPPWPDERPPFITYEPG